MKKLIISIMLTCLLTIITAKVINTYGLNRWVILSVCLCAGLLQWFLFIASENKWRIINLIAFPFVSAASLITFYYFNLINAGMCDLGPIAFALLPALLTLDVVGAIQIAKKSPNKTVAPDRRSRTV